jgi:hypothetical protein
MYHPTPIDWTCFFFCYIIQLPTGVERTQNLLYIIQRRIYDSTAYWSGAYPKFIRYHPTPIGAARAFLLYINQLPTGVERTQNLLPRPGTDCTRVYCIFCIKSSKNII